MADEPMQNDVPDNELTQRFKSLISGYATHRRDETARYSSVLQDFLAERRKWAESQRDSADDFNLFRVIGIEGDELSHSNMLAWLLDHRIEHGTHAQGSLGFRLLLKELEPDLRKGAAGQILAYAEEPSYWVRREVVGDESIVDIEIAARGKFVIHIENKISSTEGDNQTHRESKDLEARRKELGVQPEACHGVFLTVDGMSPNSERFLPVRWSRVANVFERFAVEAKPPQVRLFADHYSKVVKELSVVESEKIEEGTDDDVQRTGKFSDSKME